MRNCRLYFIIFAVVFCGSTAIAQQPNRALILECMNCHGDDGIAKDKDIPHLAGQNYLYLLKQLNDFQTGKRPHKEMKIMSRRMEEKEMEEIADYYSRLPGFVAQ